MLDACPAPDEILRWVAGHFQGTPRGVEVGLHIADCEGECPSFVQVSSAVIAAVIEPYEGAPRPPRERASFEELARAAERDRQAAQNIFAPPESEWVNRIRSASLDEGLLFQVADRAVVFADKSPAHVRQVLQVLRAHASQDANTSTKARVRALVELAEGVALRTEGDHLGALACYKRAELELPEPALDVEHPYINLARGASLRRLNRYDEARSAIESARKGFARCGVRGESKALWELTNIAWETGEIRRSFRLGHKAHKLLLEEGYEAEAPIMLLNLVPVLLTLNRPRIARELLRRVQKDPTIQRNTYERARITWNEGHLAAVEGDFEEALTLLDRAVEDLAAVGAILPAARAALDLAHVAGSHGDVVRQTTAATQAAALLERIPGQEADYIQALAELREAIAAQASVAGAVARLRQHVRPL